ncbi:hypothetical protein QL285_088684 [Trifolium repens]|nr:hypothetical protein QL285_088684 [Trifolium repens]
MTLPKKKLGPDQVGYNVFHMWHAWFDANNLQNRNQQTHTDLAWVKSQDGWIKCNVNARLFESQDITTVSCCIRNNNSEFQLSRCTHAPISITIFDSGRRRYANA